MRAAPKPACHLCQREGRVLYDGLRDRLFGAGGTWSLRQCPEPSCGLIWLDPMPVEEDIAKAYADYYTHRDEAADRNPWLMRFFTSVRDGYLCVRHGYRGGELDGWRRLLGYLAYLHPGRRAVMDFNVMWLAPVSGGRLLDVGCGSGAALSFMKERGWQVRGVDFDPQAVRLARERGLEVSCGSLEVLQFPDETFDAVTMSHVIEHLHDPAKTVGECLRVLKRGGRLVIVTPNTRSLGHRWYGEKWMHLDPPRHLHLFGTGTLRRLVEAAGFGKVEAWTSLRDAYGMFLGSRSISRTGRYAMGSPQPLTARLWARLAELGEWAALKFDSRLGEEIVVLAEK